MTSILSNELISKRRSVDNSTANGLSNIDGVFRYPALYFSSIESGDEIEVLETVIKINGQSFSLVNKTIAELLLEINGTDGIVVELTTSHMAGMPAILLEEFSSISVTVEEIIRSPVRLSSIYSDIINNIPPAKIPTDLTRTIYEIRDSGGNLMDFTTDSNYVYVEKMNGRCTMVTGFELSSFLLFFRSDKFSTAFTSISQMQDGPDKEEIISSISSYNSSLL